MLQLEMRFRKCLPHGLAVDRNIISPKTQDLRLVRKLAGFRLSNRAGRPHVRTGNALLFLGAIVTAAVRPAHAFFDGVYSLFFRGMPDDPGHPGDFWIRQVDLSHGMGKAVVPTVVEHDGVGFHVAYETRRLAGNTE